MTAYSRAAEKIFGTLQDRGLVRDDLVPPEELVQLVINCILEEEPGYNDAIQNAYLVAIAHKAMYPESVFPASGLTPDAWAARGCRLVANNIANQILRLQHDH